MNTNDDYAIPENCNFDNISAPYFSNDCSPKIKGRYTGLVINVPEVVYLKEPFSIKVACSFAHEPAKALSLIKPIKNSIVFVAVNTETHKPYSGSKEDYNGTSIPPPNRKLDPKKLEGKIVGGYVNPDLVEILGLPEKPAKYVVYATVGPYKSNVMNLEIKKQEE